MNPSPIFRKRNLPLLALALLAAGAFAAGFEQGRHSSPRDPAPISRGPAAFVPRSDHARSSSDL